MARRRKIPDKENSALVFLRAFEASSTRQPYAPELGYGVDVFPPELGVRDLEVLLGAVRAHLEANARALSLIHEGARLPHGTYPITMTADPWDIPIEHLVALRRLAWLCRLEAAFAAQRGDGAAAADSLFAVRRLCASLGGCTFTVEALVRFLVDGIFSDTLEKTLALCEMPPEKLETLSREIVIEEREASLVEAMRTERATAYWAFTAPPEQIVARLQSVRQPVPPPGAMEPNHRARDAVCFYELMGEAVRIGALPDRELQREAARLTQEIEQVPRDLLITRLLFPALSRALQVGGIARTRLKVARAALAVEQWRMKNGSWPERLEDLVPEFLNEVPQDPYSDGTIGYVRTERGGVILYSVGPDGKYNGGRSLQEGAASAEPEAYDLAFRLLPPKDRGARQLGLEDWRGGWGMMPLHLTAQVGAKEAAEQLLAKGANVNAEDQRRCTPLHLAAQGGHREVSEALLKAGAAVNVIDGEGWTPTGRAIQAGHKDQAAD
jgi:hypothetical protein